MRKETVKRRALMEELVSSLSSLADEFNARIENETRKKIASLIEKTKIDFEEFLEKIDLLQGEADTKDYQNIFLSLWSKRAPALIDVLDEMIKEHNSFSAKLAKEHILGLGAKTKAVLSGFCVSSTIEVNCESCYFSPICKQKKE